ncbi:MAG: nucleoside triphosphate pyrophosphohydrolase [Polyangia bacterium]
MPSSPAPPAPAQAGPDPATRFPPLPGKETGSHLPGLVGLMQRLLAPDGCPWDREQTLTTLLPYLIEETYEVVDAIQVGEASDHCEELGDLLLQIVFQAELRHREGSFGIDEVIDGIIRKLVRRHPHVFGEVHAQNAGEALASWAKLKAVEKAAKGRKGALDGIPRSAPALVRAMRSGEKAGAVGFDWPDANGARAKVSEELAELDAACAEGDRAHMADELGDLLLAIVNLARKLGLDAEHSLRAATDRFGHRFRYMEEKLEAAGRELKSASPLEQDRLWEEAKEAQKAVKPAGMK